MCDRGSQLIEFAFVAPLLLVVVFGIANFGLMFQRYEVLTNAAREGARVAALPGYGSADVQARVDQYLTGRRGNGDDDVSGRRQAVNVGGACITLDRRDRQLYAYVHRARRRHEIDQAVQ